ncbi:MAG: efflux RND transporter periplasmic adaptor subunit [Candidatus Binatus sp.]|jgi:RND family efflux transporter MFP subunit|uniref:efflux RND transporter periplasmic adaptor subunit n=1 Tax=Candidatus Binatus sp. TaxID=2811406 RepID=UPI003C787D6C
MEKRPARLLALFQLIACIAIFGCGHKEAAAPESIPVTVQAVAMASGAAGGAYSANIIADTQVDVAFKVNGYVQSILQVKGADGKLRNVQAGDAVTAGAVLAVVKDDTYRNSLVKAQADLQNSRATFSKAKADFTRYTHLLEQHVVSQADYDAAKQQYESAQASVGASQAAVQQAQVDLDDCKLKSPMSALVLDRKIEVGTLVSPNSVGFQIGDTSKVKVVFGVPGAIVGELKPGAAIAATVDAFPGQTFKGAISKVAAVADPNARLFDIEATIPNPDARLRVGMIAALHLPAAAQAQSVLVVPTRAIVRPPDDPKGYAVYVAEKNADGKMVATLKKVEIGPVVGDQVSIATGLDAGAQVIVRGADIVFNGASINVVP